MREDDWYFVGYKLQGTVPVPLPVPLRRTRPNNCLHCLWLPDCYMEAEGGRGAQESGMRGMRIARMLHRRTNNINGTTCIRSNPGVPTSKGARSPVGSGDRHLLLISYLCSPIIHSPNHPILDPIHRPSTDLHRRADGLMLFMSSALYPPYENKTGVQQHKKHGRNTEETRLQSPTSIHICLFQNHGPGAFYISSTIRHARWTTNASPSLVRAPRWNRHLHNAFCHETHHHRNTGWDVLSG